MSDKHWHIIRTVELGASAEEVWEVVGGFYTVHEWHPEVESIGVPDKQNSTRRVLRSVSFPVREQERAAQAASLAPDVTLGAGLNLEELTYLDTADFVYRYNTFDSKDFEKVVKNYECTLRVISGSANETCTVQWSANFDSETDSITDFYEIGFRALEKRFPLK